jgi:2-methylcitrate dehydratase PrpD
LTAAVADFVDRHPPIPPEVAESARKVIADSLSCIVAGAASEVAEPMLAYLQRTGRTGAVPLLGTAVSADPEAAALANGTFGHGLDYDDGSVLTPVHPSVTMVAALLAAGGSIDGRRFVDAYTIGVEVAIKLGVGIGIDHYERGFHGTSTLGTLGAVAALARARRLPSAVTRQALGIAASMAGGVQANFGSMVKPLHTGLAARNAVAAIELAASGFSASDTVLEHPGGFFAAFGSEHSDAARTISSLGNPLCVLDPGMSLKRYACCYASHRPMQGLLELRGQLNLDADNVDEVACLLAPGSLRALIHPRPRNGLEGKFSLEYALAAGVADGAYSLWTFTDEAVQRPHVQALLPRMKVSEDPRCAQGDPNAGHVGPSRRGFVLLSVRTRDGRSAQTRIDKLPGSPDQPLNWQDVEQKFFDCARSAKLDDDRCRSAWRTISALDACPDVADLTAALTSTTPQ